MSAKLQRREYETKQRADCADDTNKYIETSIIRTVVNLYMNSNQDYTNVTKIQLKYSLTARMKSVELSAYSNAPRIS